MDTGELVSLSACGSSTVACSIILGTYLAMGTAGGRNTSPLGPGRLGPYWALRSLLDS